MSLFFLRPLAAQQSPNLEGLDLRDDQARVKTSAPVKYQYFSLENPPRLVLELKDAEASGPRDVKGKGRWLSGARVSQFSRAPNVVRVVFDLKEAAPSRVEARGGEIWVGFGQAAASAQEPAASPAAAAVRPARAPLQAQPADDFAAEILRLTASDIVFLAAALFLMAVGAAWRLTRAKAAPMPREVPAFAPEDTAEMIEGIQQNLNALARRLSILEKQMTHLGQGPSLASASNGKVEEEVRAMKEVLRSLVKALKIPSDL